MTKVIAVCMVKDEMDIFPYIVENLFAEGIDYLFIADNLSTDGLFQWYLSTDIGMKSNLIQDDIVAYHQSAKMNNFCRQAVTLAETLWPGEDIILLPFDADEMFYSLDPDLSLSEALKQMPCDVAVATVYDHIPTNLDSDDPNPLKRMQYRMPHIKSPPSVAFKYHPDFSLAMGNHSVSHPGTQGEGVIGVRHFQYRSLEQYKRKLRNGKKAYDATNLHPQFGSHWREGGAKSDGQLEAEWDQYINQPAILDPAPLKE